MLIKVGSARDFFQCQGFHIYMHTLIAETCVALRSPGGGVQHMHRRLSWLWSARLQLPMLLHREHWENTEVVLGGNAAAQQMGA